MQPIQVRPAKKVLGAVIPLSGPSSIIGNLPLKPLFNIGVTYFTRVLRP